MKNFWRIGVRRSLKFYQPKFYITNMHVG